ncbi:hypothetical protein HGRIS_010097 [Hohenbuehelia grisea]|uniref:Fungal-type protein kinase domain-containing protein n=1 Tax=Hohenbuehelia grisea TaxID=104357 RepID=A0ABR3J3T8_9AGAR
MSSAKRTREDSPSSSPSPSKKVDLDFLAAMHGTPFRKKSNVISVDTEDLSTEELTERTRLQLELKKLMMDEFQFATYEGDWVSSHYCPTEETDVDAILTRLKTGKAPACTEQGNFCLPSWPRSSANETAYYEPFAQLLNKIIDAFEKCFPEDHETSAFRDAKFFPYDKRMSDTVAGEPPLRPDLLLLEEKLAKNAQASWQEVLLAVEVKDTWSELIWQAATYARCLFAASDHRFFVPILCLNHKRGEFRMCLFHRSGVLATHVMKFTTTVDGFRDFVATIVGMLFWDRQVPQQAGYVPEQSPVRFSLNNTEFYVHRVLCRRQAVRGRATTVYAVNRNPRDEDDDPIFPSSLISYNAPVHRMLNPFDRRVDVLPVGTQKLDVRTLPDSFIIKCSHQLKDRISELEVFAKVQGYIGIPHVLAQYDCAAFEIPEGKSPVFWKLRDELPEGRPYESRVHRHLILGSEGVRLSPELTFKQVGYAMVHAMMGHCALFTEGEMLHRDVSNGNIIFLVGDTQVDWKIPSILDDVVSDNRCTGVLIDGDVAKGWRDTRQISSDRSGTLPFVSRRLTKLWSARQPNAFHTPIDDLESFALVLVYNALFWTPDTEKTVDELLWWGNLSRGDLRSALAGKNAVFSEWRTEAMQRRLALSEILAPFSSLIGLWLRSIDQLVERQAELLYNHQSSDDLYRLSEDAYKTLVRIGLEEAAKLSDMPIKDVYPTSS